jgi:hypothetical protein
MRSDCFIRSTAGLVERNAIRKYGPETGPVVGSLKKINFPNYYAELE